MATLVARMTVLCTGAKEGTGPTLVLTTAKRGQYSSEETTVEVLWFNCGECACRVANERHLKLSCSSALCYTRVCAAHVSGTPSLLFHLSTAGVQALPLHGPRHTAGAGMEAQRGGEGGAGTGGQPHKRARIAAEGEGGQQQGGQGEGEGQGGLLTSYMTAVNTFVHRQYPSVSVHEHGVEQRVADSPRAVAGAAARGVRVGAPTLVHDSRGTGVYGGMPSLSLACTSVPGANSSSSRPGLRVWVLPVQLPPHEAPVGGVHTSTATSLACYAVHVHAHALGHGPGQGQGQGAWLAVLDWPSRGAQQEGEEEVQWYEHMRRGVLQAIQTLHCEREAGCAAVSPEVTLYHLNHPSRTQAEAQDDAPTEQYTHFPAAARHAAALHASCPLLFPAAASLSSGGGPGGASGVSVERSELTGAPQAKPRPRLYTPAGHTLQLTGPVAAAAAPALEASVGDTPALLPPAPASSTAGGIGLGLGSTTGGTGGAQAGEVQQQRTGWQELKQACTLIRPALQSPPAPHTQHAGRANQDAAAALRRSLLSAPPSIPVPGPVPAAPLPSSAGQTSLHPMPFTSSPPPGSSSSKRGSGSGGAGLTLLGTGAAAPSTLRSCSALWLRLPHPSPSPSPSPLAQEKHVGLLLDCGEGALSRLALPQLARLTGIWISHMHADHHTGLMSVLAAYMRCRATSPSSSAAAYTPLPVVGPAALCPVLTSYCRLIREQAQEEGWCWWPAAHGGTAGADGGEGEYEGIVTFTPIQRSTPARGVSPPGLPTGRPMGGSSSSGQQPLCEAMGLQHWEDVPVLHHGEAYGCVLAWCTRAEGGVAYVLCYSGDTRPCPALVSACARAVQRMQGHAQGQGEGHAGQVGGPRQIRVLLVHEATFAEGVDTEGASGGEKDDEVCAVASEGGLQGGPVHGHGHGQGRDGRGRPSRMTGRDHAIRKRHSTAEEAVGICKQLKEALSLLQSQSQGQGGGAAAEVVLLPPILTHFSARYAAEGDIRGRTPSAGPASASGSGLGQCLVALCGMQVLMASDGMTLPL